MLVSPLLVDAHSRLAVARADLVAAPRGSAQWRDAEASVDWCSRRVRFLAAVKDGGLAVADLLVPAIALEERALRLAVEVAELLDETPEELIARCEAAAIDLEADHA